MTATQPNYLTIARRTLDLEDYLDVARRHIAWILGPIFAGLVISIVVALMLPNTYESKALMQIVPAQVSESLIPSTINQQLSDRVTQMQAVILSRDSLSNLIQSPALDLYPNERKKEPIDDTIERMRKNLHIETSDVAAPGKHASTFAIVFRYPVRAKAQQTVQAFVSRFNEENQNTQTSQQSTLKNMFGDEVANARANLAKASENLTRFRMANQGRLPEQTSSNIAQLSNLQAQLSASTEAQNRLQQTRVQLETSLSSVKSQLDVARSLAQETQGYNTPIGRQNDALASLNRQIDADELKLQQLLQHFKESYPDIRDLRSSLDVAKTRRDQMLAEQEQQREKDTAERAKSQNQRMSPQMLAAIAGYQEKVDQLSAMLRNTDSEREFRNKEEDRLRKEMQTYQSRLSPSGVDTQVGDLMREQQTASDIYQQALRKQQIATQSNDIVQRRAGELLQVLESPSLPTSPSSPNRPYIVGGGVAISVIIGLALAAVQEAKDTSLKNLKDIRAYTNLPVLGSVPLLENTMLVKRKRRIAYLGWSAAVIIGLLAVCAAIVYYYTVTVNT